MKIIKYSVLIIFTIIPFLIITTINVSNLLESKKLEKQYSSIVKNSISDGLVALKTHTEANINYNEKKEVVTNSKEVINAILSTLYYGFGAIGELDKININKHIPAIIIIGYDGYYLYGLQEVVNNLGELEIRHILTEKKYYTYKDVNNRIIRFTLDEHIEIYDMDNNTIYIGNYKEGISEDIQDSFHQIRKKEITTILEKELIKAVNKHNEYAKKLGVLYSFNYDIFVSEINKITLDDVGLIMFFQGKPIGNGEHINIISVKEGNVIRHNDYIAYEKEGKKHYCLKGCKKLNTIEEASIIERLTDSKEAAKKGYRPCKKCRP